MLAKDGVVVSDFLGLLQFDACQVHRISKMLLHNRKKFANIATVLGISNFFHQKNWKFFLIKLLISNDLFNA